MGLDHLQECWLLARNAAKSPTAAVVMRMSHCQISQNQGFCLHQTRSLHPLPSQLGLYHWRQDQRMSQCQSQGVCLHQRRPLHSKLDRRQDKRMSHCQISQSQGVCLHQMRTLQTHLFHSQLGLYHWRQDKRVPTHHLCQIITMTPGSARSTWLNLRKLGF